MGNGAEGERVKAFLHIYAEYPLISTHEEDSVWTEECYNCTDSK